MMNWGSGQAPVIFGKSVLNRHSREDPAALLKRIFNASTAKLEHKRFLILDFNHYYLNGGENYIPGEMAVTEFSLEEGITLQGSHLFDPRKPRLRKAPEMKEIWEKFGLPKPMFEEEFSKWPLLGTCGTDEFRLQLIMLFNLIKGISEWDSGASKISKTFVFSKREHIHKVKACLQWLMLEADEYYEYEIFATEDLLGELVFRTAVVKTKSPSELRQFAEEVLSSKKFETDIVACKWHKQPEIAHTSSRCALNYTSNEARLILDVFAQKKTEEELSHCVQQMSINVKDADKLTKDSLALAGVFSKTTFDENENDVAEKTEEVGGFQGPSLVAEVRPKAALRPQDEQVMMEKDDPLSTFLRKNLEELSVAFHPNIVSRHQAERVRKEKDDLMSKVSMEELEVLPVALRPKAVSRAQSERIRKSLANLNR